VTAALHCPGDWGTLPLVFSFHAMSSSRVLGRSLFMPILLGVVACTTGASHSPGAETNSAESSTLTSGQTSATTPNAQNTSNGASSNPNPIGSNTVPGTNTTQTSSASADTESIPTHGVATSTSGATTTSTTNDSAITSSASSDTATQGSSTSETPSEPAVRFIGRFAHDGMKASFAWSGSGIVAAFEGTEVSLQMDDSGSNEFTVVLDGQLQPTLKAQVGSHSYALGGALTAQRHEIEIYRRTEANQGVSTFEGFDFGAQGILLAPPAPKTRRIEVIGDSISCGYGNEGADTSCTFSAETENHYLTYGAIAARALDAELTTVAWSGKGVVNNYDTDTNDPMPALYKRTLPDDANSRWDFSAKPHAVVINLGTNDFSTDGDPTTETFRDGYVDLVGQVREGAPDAFIVCTVGNMLTGADLDAARAGIHAAVDALRAAGDEKIAAWDMEVPNDDPGCDWHPKVATHELMAAALVAELKQQLKW
jgi:lysophospholipase L1-like esterase